MDESPVFIIGNPRSGTTLLRMTLNSHPLICIPPESHFFLWLEEKYSNWTPENGHENYLTDLFLSTKFETWGLNKDKLREFIANQNPQIYSDLNACVYRHYCLVNHSNTRIWGDKNKLWKDKLHEILTYYPEAKFIHIHRDGRDIACSYKELNRRKMDSKYAPKLPIEIEEIALKWKENISFIFDFKSYVNPINFLSIRYDKLLTNQDQVSMKICDFLKLEYPAVGMSHLLQESDRFDEPEEFLQWKEKINKPIDLSNIGKYKHALSKEEMLIFNEICSDELNYLNYI